jgi:hypothetical protein
MAPNPETIPTVMLKRIQRKWKDQRRLLKESKADFHTSPLFSKELRSKDAGEKRAQGELPPNIQLMFATRQSIKPAKNNEFFCRKFQANQEIVGHRRSFFRTNIRGIFWSWEYY